VSIEVVARERCRNTVAFVRDSCGHHDAVVVKLVTEPDTPGAGLECVAGSVVACWVCTPTHPMRVMGAPPPQSPTSAELLHGSIVQYEWWERTAGAAVGEDGHVVAPPLLEAGRVALIGGCNVAVPFIITAAATGVSLPACSCVPAATVLQLARVVARLHTIGRWERVASSADMAGWHDYGSRLVRLRRGAAARALTWASLPAHMATALEDFLPSERSVVVTLLPAGTAPVLLHGDLCHDNILVTSEGGLTLIDLADGCYGDALYDVIAVYATVLRGDPHALRLFLAAYNRATGRCVLDVWSSEQRRRATALAALFPQDVFGCVRAQRGGVAPASWEGASAWLWG